ncbi:MAG: DUF4373 domain-containing protein [Clostridiaceae bacterium]|jgi:hypothetical protein|nr:DUF4373 domain-containing protein [Clostridiaceae bacterium]
MGLFKHYLGIRQDPRMQSLMHDMGNEAYGIFWMITEIIMSQRSKCLSYDEETITKVANDVMPTNINIKEFIDKAIKYRVFIKGEFYDGSKYFTLSKAFMPEEMPEDL